MCRCLNFSHIFVSFRTFSSSIFASFFFLLLSSSMTLHIIFPSASLHSIVVNGSLDIFPAFHNPTRLWFSHRQKLKQRCPHRTDAFKIFAVTIWRGGTEGGGGQMKARDERRAPGSSRARMWLIYTSDSRGHCGE